MPKKYTVEHVIKIMGGAVKLASDQGVTPSAVAQWKMNGYIPKAQAFDIALASKRKLAISKMPVSN